MPLRSRPQRPVALLAALIALSNAAAFADGPVGAAVLKGRVTAENGVPLAGAVVRVAVPAVDMRFVEDAAGVKLYEARSDAKGDYRLELPGVTKRTTVSIDAMKPGYRRLVGTPRGGGDARQVEVEPGGEAEAVLELEPALYLRATVFDEQGRPIPGAKVAANVDTLRSSGGIERTASRPDGTFELFNYPVDRDDLALGEPKGVVHVSHPDYIALKIDDVYALEPNQRDALRLVLETGHKVAGTVLDAAGKPVAGATVKVAADNGDYRKGVLTGGDGRFALRGLTGGPAVLTARALTLKQKVRLEMALEGDKDGLDVRLQPIELPADLKAVDVLGMRLADVTPALKAAYDLWNDRGALILDPGKDSDRFKIGNLAEGYAFWMVGNQRVGSVREFVDRLLAETAGIDAPSYSIRVVYTFTRVEVEGTSTQYMKLTRDDLKPLRALSERLAAEPR